MTIDEVLQDYKKTKESLKKNFTVSAAEEHVRNCSMASDYYFEDYPDKALKMSKEARDILKKLSAKDEKRYGNAVFTVHVSLAMCALRAGHYKEAEEYLDILVKNKKSDRDYAIVFRLQGEVFEKQGLKERAKQSFIQSVQCASSKEEGCYDKYSMRASCDALAELFVNEQKYAEAEQIYLHLLKYEEQDKHGMAEGIYYSLATLYRQMNEYGKAAAVLEKVCKTVPNSPIKVIRVCEEYMKLGEFDKAIAMCRDYLKSSSDQTNLGIVRNLDVLCSLIEACEKAGYTGEIKELVEQALQMKKALADRKREELIPEDRKVYLDVLKQRYHM